MRVKHLIAELQKLDPESDVMIRDVANGLLVEANTLDVYEKSHVQVEFAKTGPMLGKDYWGYQVRKFDRSGTFIGTHGFIPGKGN